MAGSQKFYKKLHNNLKFSSKNFISPIILSAGDFNRYLQLSSYQELINISQKYGMDNCFCESRQNSKMINLFFDYDCKDIPQTLSQIEDTIQSLKSKLQSFLPDLTIQFYVKQSNEEPDYINSIHIITHLQTSDGYSIYFDYSNGCSQVKHFVSKLNLQHPFDHKQAYSGHLLRLIHSNKFNKNGTLSNRILQHSTALSDFDDPLRSLSSYCPNPKFMLLTDYINKHFILQYVKSHNYAKNYLFQDIIQRPNEQHLSLTLTEQHTPVCSHKSNNAVCMFYNNSNNPNIIIKCQDTECGKFFQTFFHYDDNTHQCQIIMSSRGTPGPTGNNSSDNKTVQSSNSISNSKDHLNSDLERIQTFALQSSQFLPQETAYKLLKILSIQPNSATLLGQPPQNNAALSFVLGSDNQQFQCNADNNQLYYSLNGRQTVIQLWTEMVDILKSIEKKYSEKQLEKQNIIYNYGQYVETLNQTINNYNNKDEKEEGKAISNALKIYDQFSEIFSEYPEIHKKLKYYIFDNIDTFFYIIPIIQSENFVYYNQLLYYYQPDDNCWQIDQNCVRGKAQLKNLISDYLMQMQDQIRENSSKGSIYLNKLLKEFGTRVNSYNYNQYAYTLQRPERQIFDQNNQLIHFKNTTYDVVNKKFIEKQKNHYNTFAISYDMSHSFKDYQNEINELHQILDNIFPDKIVKDWFLNSLGKNLYSVSRQKPIIFMKGIGRNGKSLIIQLIKQTLQQYCSKGKSTIFQKETFADNSKANSEIDNVIGSKICFIEEIADTQINLQTLKELTGGGEIQTRRMRQDFADKEILCQFYVACNNIPDFGSVDIAISNRLLAIEFETEFTEQPILPHQKLIDYNISEKIKEEKYKQAFVSILIEYSKLNLEIPEKVRMFTQQIQSEADPFLDFFEERIQISDNNMDLLNKQDLCKEYNEYADKNINYMSKMGKQLTNSFENYLKKHNKNTKYQNTVGEKRNGATKVATGVLRGATKVATGVLRGATKVATGVLRAATKVATGSAYKIKEEKYKQAFASILIEYSKQKLDIPEKIKIFTQEIQSEADPYIEFIEERIELTTNQNDQIKKDDICQEYNEYSGNNINSKSSVGKKLINSFENYLKKNNKILKYQHRIDGKSVRAYLYCKVKK